MPGDTLSKIARKFYGNAREWRKIYRDNAETIKNPNKIQVGQIIKIYLTEKLQREGDGEEYIIHDGDNLWKIAKRVYGNGNLWNKIFEANRDIIFNPKKLYKGQKLVIPEK